jgi:hypothetical protein|tara:strand:+ start:680 stop:961 length:282 start_codon:yes stop_codon:yes gene_type:complete
MPTKQVVEDGGEESGNPQSEPLPTWTPEAAEPISQFTRNRTRTDVPRKERDRSFKGILIFFLEIFSPREWNLPICILCCSSVFPMLAIVKSAT